MTGKLLGARRRTDDALAILADADRRAVLRALAAADEPVPVAALVDLLSTDDAPGRAFQLRLHHVHLPKMVEAGIVEYDPDAGLVVLTDVGKRVDAVRAFATARLTHT